MPTKNTKITTCYHAKRIASEAFLTKKRSKNIIDMIFYRNIY